MKKALAVVLCSAFAFSLLAGACAAGQTRVIQFGHGNPENEYSQSHIYGTYFNKYIGELSGGAIKLELFANGQLGGERDMIEGMSMGTIDMVSVASFNIGSFYSPVMFIDLPFLFNTKQEVFGIFDNEAIMKPIEDDLYEKWGVKVLGWGDSGYRYVLNNVRPVATADDLKGMKIRLPETPIYVDMFKAMGANPTTISWGETYTAVQQGTVDGLELSTLAYYPAGIHKITKYLSMTGHVYSSHTLAVSREIWDSLSAEEQGWFIEAGKKATADQRAYIDKIEQEILEKTAAEGCAINYIEDKSSFRSASESVYEKYRKEIGGELINAIQAELKAMR